MQGSNSGLRIKLCIILLDMHELKCNTNALFKLCEIQFSPLGTLCRNSTGECDVPGVCDGKSAQASSI